ncbi:LysR substrate-binding domain-containing protein [Tropicibacter naphthalenivorans]|uniref:Gcv operon activator n=1 Tax=Tropicibacter naphthalenivorans TaxID=441103 RepID=A0A0P1G722_9RHOB|nr:LysR substrate-binding domain-containing protein [Tropicibacter naphthalenivorans]CUH77388.1 Gcv operon activator [Tropicibacter naphthalenivorans]SMC58357.1 transcriptional regulator, LysR family [Tropicibacter naphthalenivorans]
MGIAPLPPITALRALEALDRLGSATAAGAELNLTQSAVSRQLKTLEDHLGAQLFLRDRRALRLTPQAAAFAQSVREGLDLIAQGAMALRLDPTGGALSLAILPTFGMRWLVPRLPDFAQRHPDVTVNMTTRLRRFDFHQEGFDAALHFGTPSWPDTHSLRLMTEQVRPLAAPSLIGGPLPLADLATLPLLHIQTRPTAWKDWFTRQNAPQSGLGGTNFDQFTTILQAALHGLGVALLPDYLTVAERASGQLIAAAEAAPVSLGDYYLVWPSDRPPSAALRVFIDWLAQQTDDDMLPR